MILPREKANIPAKCRLLMEDEKDLLQDIDLIRTDEWPIEEIVELYKAGNWWHDSYDPAGIPPLMEGSFGFIVAYSRSQKRAVGMGRLISDGVSDGYIQDIVVLPELRGKGIGRLMLKDLLEFGLSKGLVWIGLIAEEGSKEFYEKLGFKEFSGTPMLYESKEE
jgi:ribosomal protein S18 acetylase RimI-like enzyme